MGLPRALVIGALVATLGCASDAGSPEDFDMATYLEEMAQNVDPVRHRFANSVLIEAMEALPARTSERERLLFRLALAEQRLNAGLTERAISELEGLLAEVEGTAGAAIDVPDAFRESLLDFLGIAHLRRATAQHCVEGDEVRFCTLGRGLESGATTTEGVGEAIGFYERLLDADPDHLGARWLLNVAHAMEGTHPEALRPERLIPADAWSDSWAPAPFEDVAPALGLSDIGHVGGAVVDDFDGDGLLDVMATSWGLRDPIHYHRNRGDGTFETRSGSAGLEGLWGGGNLVQADYDNDGDLDALVLRGGWLPDGQPNSLLQNQGDGTFVDVTARAGLLGPMRPTQTAAWSDYDGDGWLDLAIGNETFGDRPHPVQLFHNRGDGTFEDVAPEAGVDVVGVVKGVAWGDYDNDGRPDLYLSRTGAPNVLFRNAGGDGRGGWSFEDRTTDAGVAEPRDAFPTWFWDYDNDGWLDLFVAGYRTEYGDVAAEYLGLPHRSELPRLYRNLGDGSFDDMTASAGLDKILFSMGSNFGDLDNDGWLDHYQATGDPNLQALMPNRMFRGDGRGGFEEVTGSGGFGLLEKGHGVAFADLDHDGDQDVFVAMGGAYEGDVARNVLFENPGGGGNWLSLRLVGEAANRSAIGARIRIGLETADGPRELHRTVSSGSSFGGNPLRVEVGLGDASAVTEIAITWPGSGHVDRWEGLEVDAAYRIVEGGRPERLDRTSFTLGGGR